MLFWSECVHAADSLPFGGALGNFVHGDGNLADGLGPLGQRENVPGDGLDLPPAVEELRGPVRDHVGVGLRELLLRPRRRAVRRN